METYEVTRSLLVENFLRIDGLPIDFNDYMYQQDIYDCESESILLKTGRQVGKTTLGACFIIAETLAIPFFKTLFVAPTKEQTSRFSITKLSKIIQYSPHIKRHFIGGTDNILLKLLRNGAEIILNYAQDDADRIRGPTADRIFLDEVQDMNLEATFPVIRETMANSDYQFLLPAGTPKSLDHLQVAVSGAENTVYEVAVQFCDPYTQSEALLDEKNV
jgi:phage terminase large subunit GpA-like protein